MSNPIYVGGYYMTHLQSINVGYSLGLRLRGFYNIGTIISWKMYIVKKMGLQVPTEGFF
jgi:hypothetical protein